MEKDMGELLDALAWGHRIVEVDGEHQFVFRPLTLQERNVANLVHKQAERQGKEQRLLTRKELEKQAIKAGLWKTTHGNDLKLLREELRARQSELVEEQKASAKRQTETARVKNLKARVEYLFHQVTHLDVLQTQHLELPSLEYFAERERGIYALSRATMTFPEMEQRWDSLEALKNEEDTVLVAKLLNLYYDSRIAEEAEIRKLARSPLWRIRWLGSKKNGGVKTLFGRDMYDITLDQFRLVYWSQIYDSAFESLDSPSDEVVENDKLFDQWLEDQANKRKQEKKKSEFEKSLSKTPDGQEVGMDSNGFYSEECNCGVKGMKKSLGHLHNPGCPYGVFLYYNRDKKQARVEEVQSANPESMRRLLAKEQKMLTSLTDGIEEQHLRADPTTRSAFGMPTKIVGEGNGRKR